MLSSQTRLLTGWWPLGWRTAAASDVGFVGPTGKNPRTGRSNRAAAFVVGGING